MSTLKLNQIDYKKRKYKYSLYCANCGKSNHLFNQCHNPITSYGICCFLNPSDFIDIKLLFKQEKDKNINNIDKNLKNALEDSIKYKDGMHRNNEYRLLMINRKYSLSFMEFIRGKYDVDNEDYIYNLFEKMILKEIDIICSINNFVDIRKKMNFYNDVNKKFKSELENAKLKFNYINKLGILTKILNKINFKYNTKFELGTSIGPPPGLNINNDEFFNNLQLEINKLNKDKHLYTSTEWLIPKGKRECKETDLKTAMREFYEETGINTKYLYIYKNIIPLELTFIGLNGIEYKNIYFIAELKYIPKTVKFEYNKYTHELNIINKEINKEVNEIKFLSMKQCRMKCRDYEKEQIDFLNCIFNFYINFKKFFNV